MGAEEPCSFARLGGVISHVKNCCIRRSDGRRSGQTVIGMTINVRAKNSEEGASPLDLVLRRYHTIGTEGCPSVDQSPDEGG